ncbi:MAG: hypothetical protein ABS43_20140 [Bordetella sp. SCN 67-23]|nr:hypothetical protein [Burkholderiales bacterium]ODS71655.1 MAG: hypothetical protein ABS43_20140 [Bordetella sp. SCN 67-23]OJW87367.1 MAG: hypothetical protein BGO71_28650 [Burkholderiales bacterium 67-32]
MSKKTQAKSNTDGLGDRLKNFVESMAFADVFPRTLLASHNPNYDVRRNPNLESYSRFNWVVSGPEFLTPENLPEGAQIQYLYRFVFSTETTIARTTEAGAVPEGQSIPEEHQIGTIHAQFVVEYLSAINPDQVEDKVLEIFQKKLVAFHAWNFWRELLSNLALRARLPVPSLPSFPNV